MERPLSPGPVVLVDIPGARMDSLGALVVRDHHTAVGSRD